MMTRENNNVAVAVATLCLIAAAAGLILTYAVALREGYDAAVANDYKRCLEGPGATPATCEAFVCEYHGEKFRGTFR